MTSRNRSLAVSLVLLPALLLAACGSDSSTPSVTLSSIAVTPNPASVVVGSTRQLTVTGTYSDGSSQSLTSSATFVSGTPAVATVSSPGGLVTGVAVGSSVITATAGGLTTTRTVTVTAVAPTLSSIALSPSPASVAVGSTLQLVVTGTYSDSSTQNLTSSATFASGTSAVATVSSPGGLVTGVAVGSSVITANAGGRTTTLSVAVTAATGSSGRVFFAGAFDDGVERKDFGGAVNVITVDATTTNPDNHGSLKIDFPAGGYTGAAFVNATGPRNLAAFDAVTFWAKASGTVTFEKVGLGNNAGFSGTPGLPAELFGLALTTTWKKFTLPIPLASKLTAADGLFHFADGVNRAPVTVWLSDITYETLGSGVLGAPTPAWLKTATTLAAGATYPISEGIPGGALGDLKIDYTIGGSPVTLNNLSNGYFTFTSNSTSATVSAAGLVTGVSAGSADITATLGSVATANKLVVTVTGGGGASAPTTVATAPSVASGNVISLFSSTYTGGTANGDYSGNVDTWFTSWSCNGNINCSVADYTIPSTSHVVKKYVLGTTADNFFGVETIGAAGANELDITTAGMTQLQMDVWSPNGNHLVIKLIDAGPDKIVGTADDSAKITMGGIALTQNQWQHIDLNISSLAVQQAAWTGKNVAQLVVSLDDPAAPVTLYLDNVYFSKTSGGGGGGGVGPTTVAAAPTALPANVISLFSSTYTGTAADKSANVDSYNATCFGPGGNTVADYTIAGTSHVVKAYTIQAATFGIIELIGASSGTALPPDSAICNGGLQSTTGATLLDVTTTAGIRFDVWSATGSAVFNLGLVSTDSTNTIAGQGAAPGATPGVDAASGSIAIAAGQWVSVNLPFTGPWGPPGNAPDALNRLALVKFFFSDAGTYYIDNVYFYK